MEEVKSRIGSSVIAKYVSKHVSFTLAEVRYMDFRNQYTKAFTLSMAHGNYLFRIMVPKRIVPLLTGLTPFKGVEICQDIFANAQIKFDKSKFVVAPNSAIYALVEKAEEAKLIPQDTDLPHEAVSNPQSREPPTCHPSPGQSLHLQP